VARFNSLHVWVAAGLAGLGYVLETLAHGLFDWRAALVVLTCYLVLASVVAWANKRVRRMFVDVRRSENLARFLPRQLARRILAQGGAALQPVEREVTILFSDIRDFTTRSEFMAPEALIDMLNRYFTEMTESVHRYGGTVDKFIGDGMMCFFGAPQPLERFAANAVAAAQDMLRRLEGLNAELTAHGVAPLAIGIGLHVGEVVVGHVGSDARHEYTVIGDAVNTASRIEGLTKKLGYPLVISRDVWLELAARDAFTPLGEHPVKGRSSVQVYGFSGAQARAAA